MTGFIFFPPNRIDKKEEAKRLNNLHRNFVKSFYKDWLDGRDFSQDTDFQQQLVHNASSEDVKKYFLATSEFGEEIQGEIELYVMSSRLNKASFRRKLDPISKNVIKNQSSIELFFKDIKHFDTQNSVIGSLTMEVDLSKKKDLSKFLGKAPDIRDLEINSGFVKN